ncbi:hypothetical protein R3P38DRAFT_2756673 [Favolaschia claudopus]|uniref:Uncharacterized protein n=1 Tax=Favolaschia claudopus TaxID=2862362 RepID=A0AAW0EIB5_9AGAR
MTRREFGGGHEAGKVLYHGKAEFQMRVGVGLLEEIRRVCPEDAGGERMLWMSREFAGRGLVARMLNRGRAREVSSAAIHRLHSEERHRRRRPGPPRSRSPSSDNSPSLSPPSTSPTPPLTLSDRVHIAYADDNFHLAKILLLRLQGIEVTSDNDPRIAAVKDEDFDACFVPFGRLDDVPIMSQDPVVRRADALKDKERLWDTEARRFTEERCKHAAIKRRQADNMLEQDRIRLIKQKEAAAAALDLRRRRTKPTARTLNFALVPPVPTPVQKYSYDFPFTRIPPKPTAPPPSLPVLRRRSPVRLHPPDDPPPTRVSFAQVLASMRGELFPVLPCERPLPTADRKHRALLDALLVLDLAAAELEASRKGKRRAVPVAPCICGSSSSDSSSSSTSSSSSSTSSRTSSWLSFGSARSRTSTSTSATSLSSSWASASTLLSADSPTKQPKYATMSWLPGATRTTSPEPTSDEGDFPARFVEEQRRCRCGGNNYHQPRDVPRVPVGRHPLLELDEPRTRMRRSASEDSQTSTTSTSTTSSATTTRTQQIAKTLTRLAELARGVQAAYVRAVVVGYGVGVDGAAFDESAGRAFDDSASRMREEEENGERWDVDVRREAMRVSMARVEVRREREEKEKRPASFVGGGKRRTKTNVREMGRRAEVRDVRRFLCLDADSTATTLTVVDAAADAEKPTESSQPQPQIQPTDAVEEEEITFFGPLAPLSALPSAARVKAMWTKPVSAPVSPSASGSQRRERVFKPVVMLPRSPWAPPPLSLSFGGGGNEGEAGAGVGRCRAGRGRRERESDVTVEATEGWGEEGWTQDSADQHTNNGHDRESQLQDAEDRDRDMEDEDYGPPVRVRARAVPNSAFLRLKALHHEALPLLLANAPFNGVLSSRYLDPMSPSTPTLVNAQTTAYTNANAHPNTNTNSNSNAPTNVKNTYTYDHALLANLKPRRPRECVVGVGVDYAFGSGLRFVYAAAKGVEVGG